MMLAGGGVKGANDVPVSDANGMPRFRVVVGLGGLGVVAVLRRVGL